MRRPVVEMARTVGSNTAVDGRDPVAGGRATPLNENVVSPTSNATRRAATRVGFCREIDSQAGWIGRRPVVGMAPPVIAIRWSTDERRTQTRGASKRVRGLKELRTGVERERLFS